MSETTVEFDPDAPADQRDIVLSIVDHRNVLRYLRSLPVKPSLLSSVKPRSGTDLTLARPAFPVQRHHADPFLCYLRLLLFKFPL
jgi:hypothetical protein